MIPIITVYVVTRFAFGCSCDFYWRWLLQKVVPTPTLNCLLSRRHGVETMTELHDAKIKYGPILHHEMGYRLDPELAF